MTPKYYSCSDLSPALWDTARIHARDRHAHTTRLGAWLCRWMQERVGLPGIVRSERITSDLLRVELRAAQGREAVTLEALKAEQAKSSTQYVQGQADCINAVHADVATLLQHATEEGLGLNAKDKVGRGYTGALVRCLRKVTERKAFVLSLTQANKEGAEEEHTHTACPQEGTAPAPCQGQTSDAP